MHRVLPCVLTPALLRSARVAPLTPASEMVREVTR